jgi:hypothetical protein
MAVNSETATKGVQVYRAADAPSLDESGATTYDFRDNEYLRDMAIKLASSDCSVSKLMYHNQDEGGLAIAYLFFKPNYPLFRHAHDVDTLYVVISGSIVDFMSEETLRPGDIWAVKKGNSYWYSAGPDGVEVLEMFQAAGTTTIIMTENPPERLEQAQAAVRDNEEAWKQIPEGPLFVANHG